MGRSGRGGGSAERRSRSRHIANLAGAQAVGAVEQLEWAADLPPDEVRARVLDLVRDVCESEMSGWFVFGDVDGLPLPVRWTGHEVLDQICRQQVEERMRWPGGDPRLPDPKVVDRIVLQREVVTLAELEASDMYRRCYAPRRVSDQMRAMLYFRGEHVGWLGAARRDGEVVFGPQDRRRFQLVLPYLKDALVSAASRERAGSRETSCDLLIDADGRVEFASSRGHWLLRHPDSPILLRALGARLRGATTTPRVVLGLRVSATSMRGTGGERLLLHFEEIAPTRLAPTHGLSRAQRKVSELAAAGLTIAEMARELGVSVNTVRTHLRAAYDRLGVTSRAELLAAL